MQLTMENTGDANRIHSYGQDGIVINGTRHETTTVVTAHEVLTRWGPGSVAALGEREIDSLLEMEPELIIIGTGSRQLFPSRAFMIRAIEAGIGIEAMTTPAACRTYNVLIAEQRNAMAVLFGMESTQA